MSWSQHLRSAQDFLKVGDEVEIEIPRGKIKLRVDEISINL